ncbi:MAG: ribosome biogenesis GTP-binding protein YihA/YsxC [bacterium]|nr:ribosome biogenesis GTP-binding protein YihA/YsxC [bacterium]
MQKETVQFITSYANPEDIPKDGLPHVAMLGRSNAGKSTLINSLTHSKTLAKVSSRPGLTRLVNVFDVGGRYHLVDLPGYGFASGSKEDRARLQDLLFGYLQTTERLRYAIVLIDGRIGATDSDKEILQGLIDEHIPFLIVVNKADKLKRSELSHMIEKIDVQYPGAQCIAHSSISGVGRKEIFDAINTALSQKK